MKKNLLPKMGMTALMAATAFAGVGTPVLAAAGTNYGATIEKKFSRRILVTSVVS